MQNLPFKNRETSTFSQQCVASKKNILRQVLRKHLRKSDTIMLLGHLKFSEVN